MTPIAPCPSCGGPLIRRSRPWLVMWALILGFAGAIALRALIWLAAPALILFAIAAYLLFWALAANGYWCRACKRFPSS